LWNKFRYLFMPPGWSHTGEHKTARVMKQQAADAEVVQAS
jgi:hypothetical protein